MRPSPVISADRDPVNPPAKVKLIPLGEAPILGLACMLRTRALVVVDGAGQVARVVDLNPQTAGA